MVFASLVKSDMSIAIGPLLNYFGNSLVLVHAITHLVSKPSFPRIPHSPKHSESGGYSKSTRDACITVAAWEMNWHKLSFSEQGKAVQVRTHPPSLAWREDPHRHLKQWPFQIDRGQIRFTIVFFTLGSWERSPKVSAISWCKSGDQSVLNWAAYEVSEARIS